VKPPDGAGPPAGPVRGFFPEAERLELVQGYRIHLQQVPRTRGGKKKERAAVKRPSPKQNRICLIRRTNAGRGTHQN